MKKLILLLLFIANICSAQENVLDEKLPEMGKENPRKGDIRFILTSLIPRNATNKYALIEGPKNYGYFFSITLSFDDSGKIDAVYFSKNRPQNVTDLLGLNAGLVKKIKDLNLEYKQYASKLVLIPFFYHRLGDTTLDYKSGFLQSMENLLPDIDYPMSKKSWMILDTMMTTFGSVQ